ncbi:uncharacterized protein LOC133883956 [Phragmites australis]|uniref:uncharacterized protein LOC133883956 n=1 Tax=Phragmites australis TaxID=29695 RepID=UPI002D76FCD1|nr:uncharacterized protein LOC133883956 [Phragmites australis]
MASPKEGIFVALQPLPPPPPLRPKMGNVAEPAAGGGVLKCACFRLPSRSKKKPVHPPATTKLSSASRRGVADVPDALPASHSQRVTFLASASLSTWWPSSPSAAAAGPVPASGGGNVAPRRASTSSSAPRNAGVPRASSSSFSYWRRSLSSRVMPQGARASFSFPTSPASASSSCMSTPKIPHGCHRQ